MENNHPDLPGSGGILIYVDEQGKIHVIWTDMEMYVLVDLFYKALISIPNSYNAITLALERYKSEINKS